MDLLYFYHYTLHPDCLKQSTTTKKTTENKRISIKSCRKKKMHENRTSLSDVIR